MSFITEVPSSTILGFPLRLRVAATSRPSPSCIQPQRVTGISGKLESAGVPGWSRRLRRALPSAHP